MKSLGKPKKTVLVIDDSLQVTQYLQCIIENYGYDVLVKNCPLRAIETFRERHAEIDLIVVDYAMPRMNGMEFSAGALAIRPTIPIILISGFPFEAEYVFSAGIKGYMKKPFDRHEFLTLCRRAIFNFRPGDHTAFSFRDSWEYKTLINAYIFEGLEMGERIIFAANRNADYPCCLRDGSIYKNPFFNPELFLAIDATDMRDPENFFRLIAREKRAISTKNHGKRNIRYLMDMDWMRNDPEGAVKYEKAINSKYPIRNLHIMCQFNESLISYDMFRELMDYHTRFLLGTEILN